MFEAIVMEQGRRRDEAPKPGRVDAVELRTDCGCGVRLETGPGDGCTIAFRVGDRWTTPVELRELVRAQARRDELAAHV